MKNWEVQEMKDNLVLLKYELEGTRDGKTLANAFSYINDLEERLYKIANDKDRATKLLKENGYAVKRLTKGQIEDCKKCEECSSRGENMECIECSCSVCIMQ